MGLRELISELIFNILNLTSNIFNKLKEWKQQHR